jgi:hypothetical protein
MLITCVWSVSPLAVDSENPLMPDEQQSPAIQGVEAKALAGEVQVVTSHGTASGAGSAGAVGSSIAEAVGNAAGTGAAVGEAGSHNITVPPRYLPN